MDDKSDIPEQRPEGRFPDLSRREAIGGALALCAFSAMPAWAQAEAGAPQEGDFLVRKGDKTLTPLTLDDIDPAAKKSVIAIPLDPATKTERTGNLAKVLLVRLDPTKLKDETAALAIEGVVAYSAICTHAGCEVATFKPSDGTLTCPCHGSQFDPKNAGKVLHGPAKAPLATLAIKQEDGKLVVAGSFEGKVGAQG